MTIKECYEQIGADFEEAMRRMMMEERIERFAGKFLADPSYAGLAEAMEKEDYDAAFRMAHTLKGVCQNLSLTDLCKPAEELTDALRESTRDIALAKSLMPEVTKQYERTTAGIRAFVEQ